MSTRSPERRRRLTHRGIPALIGVATAALALGVVTGSLGESGDERAAREFGEAWQAADWRAMHTLLAPDSRRRVSVRELRDAYLRAAGTATGVRVRAGDPRGESGGRQRLPVEVRTRVFGVVRGEVLVPVEDERVVWSRELVFPGLRRGRRLTRRSDPPRRARILARDGRVLAQGPAAARGSPLGSLGEIGGRVEPEETAAEREALWSRGFPRRWPVGQTGLERAFERYVAGRPGGELRAGGRVLARARPRPAPAARSTVDVKLQEAAVSALGGRFGGIAVLDARSGEIRALAGIAFSAPQPPGSTFKLVTATAALEDGVVTPAKRFPVETRAVIDGVELENANGESCGGSFRNSFAHSCNSVFAPLGVRLGAERLVEAAERYGFNGRRSVPGEVPSTLPPAAEIRSDLELGSTAIGQGKVLATPLRLASMAQAVAAGGVWTEPTLRPGEGRRRVRAASAQAARTLAKLMVDVVGYGTGTAAAIPGVKVAGKTGTAELEDTRGPEAEDSGASNTDAWFTAFAPADNPKLAVGVLFVRAGAGGETAAPAAKVVLQAGLGGG